MTIDQLEKQANLNNYSDGFHWFQTVRLIIGLHSSARQSQITCLVHPIIYSPFHITPIDSLLVNKFNMWPTGYYILYYYKAIGLIPSIEKLASSYMTASNWVKEEEMSEFIYLTRYLNILLQALLKNIFYDLTYFFLYAICGFGMSMHLLLLCIG